MPSGTQFRLTTGRDKYLWQAGWYMQHQRLLDSLSSQSKRAPIVLSGDLHAIGHASIERSGDLDLTANPVHAVLTGPVGTERGWPSAVRGSAPMAATGLVHETHYTRRREEWLHVTRHHARRGHCSPFLLEE